MPRSVILFSTPTSANGSLFRSATHLAAGLYRPIAWASQVSRGGREADLLRLVPPAQDCLIKYNAPDWFNQDIRLADYRYILNARDPRDMLCNQYHWQFVHGVAGETPEAAEARKQRVRAQGMDRFVLDPQVQHYLGGVLDGFLSVARRIAPPDRIFVGYAMYCLHFDVAMQRLADFLGVQIPGLPRAQRKALNKERVENLPRNRAWIGQIWGGTDTAPGRHRHELQPETIRILTERHARFLDFLRRIDDPRVAATYD